MKSRFSFVEKNVIYNLFDHLIMKCIFKKWKKSTLSQNDDERCYESRILKVNYEIEILKIWICEKPSYIYIIHQIFLKVIRFYPLTLHFNFLKDMKIFSKIRTFNSS